MSDIATTLPGRPPAAGLLEKKMGKTSARISGAVVLAALVGGLGFIGFHVVQDLGNVTMGSFWPYALLGLALLIALAFEFVNGFHDTANAVATVIYTHSLEPNIAVVWSGMCNLAGVLTSTGTVAFTVITLLPVLLPVGLVTVVGPRADPVLAATHRFVSGHARQIGVVIEVVFAVYLVVRGIGELP